jgi:hypothetical protein
MIAFDFQRAASGRTITSLAMLAFGTALAACSATDDPAKVCAASDTQQQVRLLLGRAANELAAKLKGALPPTDADFTDGQHVQALKLDLITLTSADATTHKINCSAQASVQISPATAAKLKEVGDAVGGAAAVMGGGQIALAYSRQPQANGQGFVYSLENADTVATLSTALIMNAALQKSGAPPVALPAPASAQADLSAFPGGPYKPINLPGTLKGNTELCAASKECHDATGEEDVTIVATDGANAIVKIKDDLFAAMTEGVLVTCQDGAEALPFHLQHPDACGR